MRIFEIIILIIALGSDIVFSIKMKNYLIYNEQKIIDNFGQLAMLTNVHHYHILKVRINPSVQFWISKIAFHF